MFQAIRYRLLFSYLAVLTLILGVFAIAVRITFAYTLREELENRLAVLAESASGELDLEDKGLEVDGEDILLNPNQSVQWFDLEGRLINQLGDDPLTVPFDPDQTLQTQTVPYPVKGITLPVREEERNDELIGYVRVSESLEGIHETLRRLDWRLGGGVVLALILSGLGGIWLTRQAMQPIERSFQRLQQFTADASHELRNPLMAIKSNAAVALKYAEGIRKSDAEKFRAIASATTQMTALTEDLLLLARTDQAPRQKQDNVNLTALLGELVRLYSAQAKIKHIHLKGQILKQMEVSGDAVQLTRLFTNLLSNALRYTPKQGCIEIQTRREGNQILVSVQDTGIGIAPAQLERIFDRFWRADRSRSYGSGFGLGLAIARNIAQNHGGSITVTSQLGAGSCFTVRLPADVDRVSTDITADRHTAFP
ncbi:MAG: HAMP domain-containing histidine kinase [Cyanobacteria bacterium CRU_2_1]|nr:HAMP domain-containing histidine kinase [Cyanobacteria bacterium RU_5_0]NJR63922.1 HAMP domain-containing histidine kinase [Cyanobacteria bacterium CRU_2_1]